MDHELFRHENNKKLQIFVQKRNSKQKDNVTIRHLQHISKLLIFILIVLI